MTCDDFENLIEDIASGERALDPDVQAHLAACPRCAAALVLAQRIEAALAARPQPQPPPDFARTVVARVRGERWREEQRFDRAFNATLGVAGVLIVAGVVAALNLSGLSAVLRDTSSLLAQGANIAMARISSAPTILVGVLALLSAAAFTWWWAEDRYSW